MALVKIQAKTKDKPTPVEAEYDFGEAGLKGLVARFGEDVVESRAKAALVIDVQALMRRHIDGKDEKGNSTFDLAKMKQAVREWKPTVSNGVRRSASERIEESVQKMSPEERDALLARLQAMAKGNVAAGGGAVAGAPAQARQGTQPRQGTAPRK